MGRGSYRALRRSLGHTSLHSLVLFAILISSARSMDADLSGVLQKFAEVTSNFTHDQAIGFVKSLGINTLEDFDTYLGQVDYNSDTNEKWTILQDMGISSGDIDHLREQVASLS